MSKRLYQILALIWLTIIIIVGAYDARKLMTGDNIQFDLLALLPQSKTEKMRLSNELMEDGNISGRIVIAFGHKSEKLSKEALLNFRIQLASSKLPLLENDIKQIESDYKTLLIDLYPFRAGLLSKDDRKHLLEGQGELVSKKAISNILSPFGIFSAAQITSDPFGFYPRFATSLRAGGSVQTDTDSNIVVKSQGKVWYIYQGVITEKIFSLKLQEKISDTLIPILVEIEQNSGVEILKVGAAFYASAGAQLAQSEISKISFISTIGIILLLLLIFHRPNPIFLAVTVVISGLICGLAACLYFFGSIHILSLVFGCSLVGVSVDYALHYYCASFKSVDRFKILPLLLPAMPLGVLTSSIGYGALVIAPFPGIQQMAILACVGLLCTFISVSLWGPFFIKSHGRKIPQQALKTQQFLEKFALRGSTFFLKKIFLLFIIPIICIGVARLTFDDNVRHFQSKDPILQSQEEQIKTLLNFDNSTKFLAVSDSNIEVILQAEEEMTRLLDEKGIVYRSLSELIPSQKRQQENSQLKLQFCVANFKEIAEMLGVESPFDFLDAGFNSSPIIADANFIKKLPTGWKELIHVGEDDLITGRVMLNSPIAANSIGDYAGVNYIDPVQEYTSLFSSYRRVMMILVASLLIGFALVISIRQGLRAAIAISTPVLLSILITVGLLGLLGIGFSMFHAMGLILVLCIGIDYALFLYWRKKEEKELLLLGNAMAAVTTILSFGVLTLSTTAAVHSFGLTVLIGIILNFFITTFFMETTSCKKS